MIIIKFIMIWIANVCAMILTFVVLDFIMNKIKRKNEQYTE